MKKMNTIISSLLVVMVAALVAVGCSADKDAAGPGNQGGSDSGVGGSLARFTIVGDFLYTVDNQRLKVVSLEDPKEPRWLTKQTKYLGFDLETIFSYNNMLFIGARGGMHIYSLANPASPEKLSFTNHMPSCDPVVVAGNYAYVTLRTGNACNWGLQELQVYDVTDPTQPIKKHVRQLSNPGGLGVDEAAGKLFVSTDTGLKVFDISVNPEEPELIVGNYTEAIDLLDIDIYDVIPLSGLLIVTGADGVYQFDYTGEKITVVSKFPITRK